MAAPKDPDHNFYRRILVHRTIIDDMAPCSECEEITWHGTGWRSHSTGLPLCNCCYMFYRNIVNSDCNLDKQPPFHPFENLDILGTGCTSPYNAHRYVDSLKRNNAIHLYLHIAWMRDAGIKAPQLK